MKNIENDAIKLAWENEQLRNENARLKEFLDTAKNCAIQMREDLEDYKKFVENNEQEQYYLEQYRKYLEEQELLESEYYYISYLEDECKNKDQRIAELEKENEELKQQLAEQVKTVNIERIETFDNRKRW